MPNTAKSHALQPHAYPLAAREKLQQQQQQQQRSSIIAAGAGSNGGGFSPSDAPLSARPFMTMAAAPFPAATSSSAYYHHHPQSQLQQQQQQQRHQIALPSHPLAQPQAPYTAPFHSYASYQQLQHIPPPLPAYTSSSSNQAMDMYEKLQPTRAGASARAAWRDEIQQRARAMDRAVGTAASGRLGSDTSALGTKRPAPSSPDASPRHQTTAAAFSYDPKRTGMRGFDSSPAGAAPVSRAYSTTPVALGSGALPTLSCLLQRNADASSSAASTPASRSNSALLPASEPSHEPTQQMQYVNKRQRVFAPPMGQQSQQHVSAAMLARHAGDLTGTDNRHLRSILEQEVAFYNQRSAQRPAKLSGAAASSPQSFGAPARTANRPKSVLYGARPTLAHSAERAGMASASPYIPSDSPVDRASDASSPSLLDSAATLAQSSPRVLAKVASGNSSGSCLGPVADAQFQHARSASNGLPVDTPPRETQFMHCDGPSSRHVAHKLDLTSLRSPPHRRQQYPTASPVPPLQQTQCDLPLAHQRVSDSRVSAPAAGAIAPLSRAPSLSSDRSSSSCLRSTSVPTSTTTTSGYRRFTTSGRSTSGDGDQQLTGESVIEAASGLLEERSPSKRESITKLLLKSKEFLKAKSLVRNRNNEIDWVATFLNVGFESSSIYSLMCPLRKGRWKTEEEKYTMELLRLIESGTVRLRHGQSIRGFIAKKLHSDDMRVLKKLSNCKMFHFARMITPHMSEEEAIDESVPGAMAALARLETLRSEFLRSVQLEALVAVRKYLSDSSIRELLNGRD